ncbi:MAG TPA: hypothetical protein VMU02_07265 [bacterium]|nr:hypothetical protein [bacterium]
MRVVKPVVVLVVLVALASAVASRRLSPGTLGIWVAALLTLSIFSFLYKDNRIYKLAEHLFIGVSAGYSVSLEYWNVFRPNLWNPLVQGLHQVKLSHLFSVGTLSVGLPHFPGMLLFFPFALGILLFTRFSTRLTWLSRWSIAAMVGSYAGLAMIGALQGDLVAQIRANMIPLIAPGSIAALRAGGGTDATVFALLGVLSNPLIIFGLISTLVYFFFSREHKGSLGVVSRVGVWFLMVSFGASFGYTVMSRVSLLIGRLHFLLSDWLRVIH